MGIENRVLVGVHEPTDTGGAATRYLDRQGVPYDVALLPPNGKEFPSPSGYKGYIILGGTTSVHHPSMARNIEWMQKVVEAKKPGLAVCLGHQVLAKALGGDVTRASVPEVGYVNDFKEPYMVELTDEGAEDPLLSPLTKNGVFGPVFLYHTATVVEGSSPKLAVVARRVNGGSVQAIRERTDEGELGDFLGVQYHPDAEGIADLIAFEQTYGGVVVDLSRRVPEEIRKEVQQYTRRSRLRLQKPFGQRLMTRVIDGILAA